MEAIMLFIGGALCVGAWGFWCVAAIVWAVISAWVRDEECSTFRSDIGWGCGSAVLLVVGVACLAVFGDLWPWLCDNYTSIIWAACVYPVAGFVWSVVRWAIACWKGRFKMMDAIAYVRNDRKYDGAVPAEKMSMFVSSVNSNIPYACPYRMNSEGKIVPIAWYECKARIAKWLAWWPFSLTEWIIGDLVRNLWSWIVSLFRRLYQAIALAFVPDSQVVVAPPVPTNAVPDPAADVQPAAKTSRKKSIE